MQKRIKKIRFSLIFNRANKLNKWGQGLIQIKAYQNKNRFFSTQIYIEPKYWDEKTQRVNIDHPNSYIFNKQIREQMELMEAYENNMINRYGFFRIDNLHEYTTPTKRTDNFISFLNTQIDLQDIEDVTKKVHRATYHKLLQFTKGKPIFFDELTYTFLDKFYRFLNTQCSNQRGEPLAQNTIHKHLKNVKTYVNLAIKHDLIKIDDSPFKKFKLKWEKTEKIYLTAKELERIEKLKFTLANKKLEKVRDFLLIGCYTGLRYGDIKKICFNDVIEQEKGYALKVKAGKTNKFMIVPLYALFKDKDSDRSKAETIIIKYAHHRKWQLDSAPSLKKYPVLDLSNQYINKGLKEVAALAKIQKKITTHTGRHTFASILATRVKTPTLQKLLQHSDLKTTQIYIHTNGKHISDELEKIKW